MTAPEGRQSSPIARSTPAAGPSPWPPSGGPARGPRRRPRPGRPRRDGRRRRAAGDPRLPDAGHRRRPAVRPEAVRLMRLVFLDTGPLGMVVQSAGPDPGPYSAGNGPRTCSAAGVRVFVPEVADYEVRRELIRAGKAAGLRASTRSRRRSSTPPSPPTSCSRRPSSGPTPGERGAADGGPRGPRRRLHPGRAGDAGGRAGRLVDRGDGQPRAPGPVRQRPALGTDQALKGAEGQGHDRRPVPRRPAREALHPLRDPHDRWASGPRPLPNTSPSPRRGGPSTSPATTRDSTPST